MRVLKTLGAAAVVALVALPALAQPAPIPAPIYGVTMDGIDHLSQITDALQSLSRKPTTRIVFDEQQKPSYYAHAVPAIASVSYVMGEILDSQYVKSFSVADYSVRTSAYLQAFGNTVDVWEVGNEVNGEWLGNTPDVVAKIHDAYSQAKALGYKTALTLYYNGPADNGAASCWSDPNHEMWTWAQVNIPDDMKAGLDYVLISFYDEDCKPAKPDWPSIFQQLAAMFPNSHVGFGENGAHPKDTEAKKASYIQRYYGMQIPVSSYIGGHFWWYGKEDLVPKTKPLWSVFNQAIGAY